MEYTLERIEALAAAARITLTKEEAEQMKTALDRMRGVADALCDTDVAPDPFFGAVGLARLREDTVVSGLSQKESLAPAPLCEDGYFVVPRTVEEA